MAIAKQLIFKPSALTMHHFMLEQAVNMEISGQVFNNFGKST